jgi:hypothetical protein
MKNSYDVGVGYPLNGKPSCWIVDTEWNATKTVVAL